MCRMIVAKGNIDMNLLLDSAIIMSKDLTKKHEKNKGELGSWIHQDGWGIAYLNNNKWIVQKSTKPFFEDTKVNKIRSLKTEFIIIHIRRACVGNISLSNTHPFSFVTTKDEEKLFFHNGKITEPITFSKKYKTNGETDSEKLFYSILTDMAKKNPIQAVKENLMKYAPSKGSNVIITSKENVLVGVKKNTKPKYYHMHVGEGKNTKIISSEVLSSFNNLKWKELKGSQVAVLNRNTQTITIH